MKLTEPELTVGQGMPTTGEQEPVVEVRVWPPTTRSMVVFTGIMVVGSSAKSPLQNLMLAGPVATAPPAPPGPLPPPPTAPPRPLAPPAPPMAKGPPAAP